MKSVWIVACMAVTAGGAMSAGGCNNGDLVANPSYKAWEAFEPGSIATLEGVRKTGDAPAGRKVRITQKLVEKTPDRVVIERTIQSLENVEGKAMPTPPLVTKKAEPAMIDPEDNPRTHPQGKVKDLGAEDIRVKDRTYSCRLTEVSVHVEYGEPLPSKEDVLLRTAANPEIPGGTVRLFLSRQSSTHNLEIASQLVDFNAIRKAKP